MVYEVASKERITVRARRIVGDRAPGPEQIVGGRHPDDARFDRSRVQVAANRRGDVALAWTASCRAGCGGHVVAAVAPAGAGFKPTEQLAEIGAHPGQVALTLNERGDAVAAWTETSAADAKRRLVLATAPALPSVAPSPGDRRPPRVRLAVRRSDLRAAVRTGRIALRVGCDEPCAFGIAVPRLPGLELDSTALRAAGTRTLRLRVPRRQLARALRRGPVLVRAVAGDRAGNVRVAEIRA